MRKNAIKLVCLLLCACLLFSGCSGENLQNWLSQLRELLSSQETAFSQIEYEAPDLQELEMALAQVEEGLSQGVPVAALMDRVDAFYQAYYSFHTQYALANIYYYQDLTDRYWEEQYSDCMQLSARADQLLDTMLWALADCPLRQELEQEQYFGKDFFAEYEGESLWTEELTLKMEEEAKLQSQYYEIAGQYQNLKPGSREYYDACGQELAQLLVDMVKLRNEIAKAAGYENYLDFAYDDYYRRDYTYQQLQPLLQQIKLQLVPIYQQVLAGDVWEGYSQISTYRQTFDYVRQCAQAMGGRVEAAFVHMEAGGFYDISYGPNKYDAAFEIYLYSYGAPFIYMNPWGTVYDQLTFVHEFGHYCQDHASYGTVTGVDIAEIFSQGMEYLSLDYVDGAESLERLKLADGLCTYVEQAAYGDFEHQIYLQEDLTVEKLQQIYTQVGEEYGFAWEGWDSRDFVDVIHLYVAPLYVISYVVSNDAAFQLYQLEQETPGAGLQILQTHLDTEETGFLSFLQSAGLESPFAPGRIADVSATFREIFAIENGAAISAAPDFISTVVFQWNWC